MGKTPQHHKSTDNKIENSVEQNCRQLNRFLRKSKKFQKEFQSNLFERLRISPFSEQMFKKDSLFIFNPDSSHEDRDFFYNSFNIDFHDFSGLIIPEINYPHKKPVWKSKDFTIEHNRDFFVNTQKKILYRNRFFTILENKIVKNSPFCYKRVKSFCSKSIVF